MLACLYGEQIEWTKKTFILFRTGFEGAAHDVFGQMSLFLFPNKQCWAYQAVCTCIWCIWEMEEMENGGGRCQSRLRDMVKAKEENYKDLQLFWNRSICQMNNTALWNKCVHLVSISCLLCSISSLRVTYDRFINQSISQAQFYSIYTERGGIKWETCVSRVYSNFLLIESRANHMMGIICETNHIIYLVFLLASCSVRQANTNLLGCPCCQQTVKWRELITL